MQFIERLLCTRQCRLIMWVVLFHPHRDPLMEQCVLLLFPLYRWENGDQKRLILMTLDRDSKRKKNSLVIARKGTSIYQIKGWEENQRWGTDGIRIRSGLGKVETRAVGQSRGSLAQCRKLLKWSEVKSLSRVRLFVTLLTIAHQAPPSMGFSRQEHWSGLPFPSPGDSWPRDWTQVSRIVGRCFNFWATTKLLNIIYSLPLWPVFGKGTLRSCYMTLETVENNHSLPLRRKIAVGVFNPGGDQGWWGRVRHCSSFSLLPVSMPVPSQYPPMSRINYSVPWHWTQVMLLASTIVM